MMWLFHFAFGLHGSGKVWFVCGPWKVALPWASVKTSRPGSSQSIPMIGSHLEPMDSSGKEFCTFPLNYLQPSEMSYFLWSSSSTKPEWNWSSCLVELFRCLIAHVPMTFVQASQGQVLAFQRWRHFFQPYSSGIWAADNGKAANIVKRDHSRTKKLGTKPSWRSNKKYSGKSCQRPVQIPCYSSLVVTPAKSEVWISASLLHIALENGFDGNGHVRRA